MDTDILKRRNTSIDIIRIVALFTVVSVHFFLYNGFYSAPFGGTGPIESVIKAITYGSPSYLSGLYMFIMYAMRTFFGVCVPLFIMLTGYLMSNKTLSRGYYKGIRKTLIVFVLASVLCFLFRALYLDETVNASLVSGDIEGVFKAFSTIETLDFKHFIFGILDFTHANYAWYIEMYIGLFLMAPFLNLGYHKLQTKRRKQVLVLTFIFISILPTAFNIFNFDSASWWLHPGQSDAYQKFIPAFWVGIYPVTYYFTGMYLREYGLRPKTKSLVWMLCIAVLLSTAFNIYRCRDGAFKAGSYGNWHGFYPYVESILLFEILRRIDSAEWKPGVKLALYKVSDLVLGAYLMSYVTDTMIYDVLKEHTTTLLQRFPYFFITVPLSFLCSLLLSFVLNLLYKGVMKLYDKLKAFVISQREKDTGYMWQDILFYSLFVLIIFVMLWKYVYGLGGGEEAYYLTVPHRLLQGDALFTDEWSFTQLSGILLLPFTWLYTVIINSTEGIILGARVCYIIVHSLAAVLIYTRLRKHGYAAAFGVLLYYLFTPHDIMALGCDSMGLELVVLTGVLLGTADYDKKLCVIFSGIAFAGAVLCNPYLAAAYVLYAICALLHTALKKKDTRFVLKSRMFAPKTFLRFSIGFGAPVIALFLFLALTVGLGDVFRNLPHMLEMDGSFGGKLGSYFSSIFSSQELFKYLLYAYAAMLIALIFDRKRREHRSVYLIISFATAICNLVIFLPDLYTESYNWVLFPMIFVTVTSYVLCEQKPKELFVGLFCLGLVYSVCLHFTSDRDFNGISVALCASNLAGFIFLAQVIREMREKPDTISYALWTKRLSFVLAAFLIVLQGGSQLSAKTHHVYMESEPELLTSVITEGPAKGVNTSPENLQEYNGIYNELKDYDLKARGNILFFTDTAYPYLSVDGFSYGTYSARLDGDDQDILRRLNLYFALNPDKTPKYIYIAKNSRFDAQTIIKAAQEKGYQLNQTEFSFRLEK